MNDNDSQQRDTGAPGGNEDRELISAAIGARANAYCPYSNFAVGAAVRTADGRIFTGANVENASYGLTICAERNAISAAVNAGMRPGELAAIALAAAGEKPATPCGACRQVIAEFADSDTVVISVVPETELMRVWRIAELLPEVFRL